MALGTLLNFRTIGSQSKGNCTQCDRGLSFSDVRRFLDAKRPTDFNKLLGDYSSTILPLFGRCENSWDGYATVESCETKGDQTTAIDCQNMSALLRYGLLLCHFADDPNTDYDSLEEAGLIIHEVGDRDDQVTISIQLENARETERFLHRGMALTPPGIGFLSLTISDSTMSLWLTSDSIGIYDNDPSLMCEALLDHLTDLMLYDVRVKFQRHFASAISHSPASSLWLAMLAGSLSGRVGLCEVCGKPYVAKRERGQRRKTCSDRCRKALSNNRRYAKRQYSACHAETSHKLEAT